MEILKTGDLIYNCDDYPYKEIAERLSEIKCEKMKGSRSRKPTVKYLYYNVPCAFDIEVTSYNKGNEHIAFMYHWQFDIMVGNEHYVCFGSFWHEYKTLIERLSTSLNLCKKLRLVCYVHNLAYEYQFLRSIHRDNTEDAKLFATDKRKPLFWVTDDYIEYRCSYKLSNMSLAKFCKNSEGVTHFKLSGNDYNYKKIRTPFDKVTEEEKQYDYNDVAGLCECIKYRLEDDTIATIPLTSTGYVRRTYRNAVNKEGEKYRKKYEETAINEYVFTLSQEAFRGGNTAANPIYTGVVLKDVGSFDIQSSYPAAIAMSDRFPVGKWQIGNFSPDKLKTKCCIMRARFENLRLKSDIPSPYLDVAHCRNMDKDTDRVNGRILRSKSLEVTLTEIDLEIILNQYKMDKISIADFIWCDRGMLPRVIREKMVELYKDKTTLKGVKGKEYEYNKKKNLANASYGMCVSSPIHPMIVDNENGWDEIPVENVQSELDKFYNNKGNFLHYTWGVYVTAIARKNLQELIDVCGKYTFVYCDTDSVKFLMRDKEKVFKAVEEINKRVHKRAHNVRPVASAYKIGDDGKKKEYCLGVWDWDCDTENGYSYFRTYGAKKYAYEAYDADGNYNLHITVAGCAKSAATYLERQALKEGTKPIDQFKEGLVIPEGESGRTVTWFCDKRGMETFNIKGKTFEITSSYICIDDTSYTLGITDEYRDVIYMLRNGIEACVPSDIF